MSFSLNKVIIIGRAGADPELGRLPSGRIVANFSLCTDKRRRNANGEWVSNPQWHNIAVFDDAANYAMANIRKGDDVHIEGEISYRKADEQRGHPPRTNIVAHMVQRAARPTRDAGQVDDGWVQDYSAAPQGGQK